MNANPTYQPVRPASAHASTTELPATTDRGNGRRIYGRPTHETDLFATLRTARGTFGSAWSLTLTAAAAVANEIVGFHYTLTVTVRFTAAYESVRKSKTRENMGTTC